MNSVVTVNSLELREKLKALLRDSEIYTVDDFIEHSVGVFKNCFQLTFADWHSIINAFIALHATRKVQDSIIGAILRKPGKRKETPCNALLINLFDEKYVVSTIKKGKRLHEDYIFKSLARGVVFSSREDAQRFAELICANNGSHIIVHDITSAHYKINVVLALTSDRKDAAILFGKDLTEESVLQAFIGASADGNNFCRTHRAYKLALVAVERINQIYDYEIAEFSAFVCDENGATATEIASEESTAKVVLGVYTDIQAYTKALEQQIDSKKDDFYTWGKNAALSDSRKHSMRCIERQIDKYLQWLHKSKDDAGITEEDVAYGKGYTDGLKIALQIQKECVSDSLVGKVALIDCLETVSRLGVDMQSIVGSVKVGNCEIAVDYFENLDAVNGKVVEYDAFYVLCGGRMSHSEEDAFVGLQKQFYAMHGKQLYYIYVSKKLKKQLLDDLFLLSDLNDDDEK